GNVFDTVNGQIDVFFKESFFELLDKDALAADLGERSLLHGVTGGLDDDDLGFHGGRLEDAFAYVLRLPFGEMAAPGSDSNGLHERSRPGRKRSRMASIFWILRRKSFSPCSRRAGSSRSFSSNSSMRASICVCCSGERFGTRCTRSRTKAARSSFSLPRNNSTIPISSTLACHVRNLSTCSSTIASARGTSLCRASRFCSTIWVRSSML